MNPFEKALILALSLILLILAGILIISPTEDSFNPEAKQVSIEVTNQEQIEEIEEEKVEATIPPHLISGEKEKDSSSSRDSDADSDGEDSNSVDPTEPIDYSQEEIKQIIEDMAVGHNIPDWFLKSIIHRESTFNELLINMDDGIEGDDNWNKKREECAFTTDGYPHGVGLTQLTGWMYQGSPYPFCLDTPNNDHEPYYYAMNKDAFGEWISMEEVTILLDPFDPEQNIERFITGYAQPAFDLFSGLYDESEEETWRRVAFHWNKGMYVDYDPDATYLILYNEYVELYKEDTIEEVKVAFIGDQGLRDDSRAVLQLIEDEGVDLVMHQGDFDYADDPNAFDDQINDILGSNFPYVASIGNHDEIAWSGYEEKLQERIDRIDDLTCSGDIGVKSSCTYKGIFMVFSGIGIMGEDHESYMASELESSDATWKICSWHKVQELMQVGGKPDEVGWEIYETCREQGAIIATAHEHVYSRTHLMSHFETQEIASTSSTLTISEGETFAFVSGLAGKSIREQEDDLAANPWWASVYTETQDAKAGALFCTFNENGIEEQANCYFKDIEGNTPDEFDLISTL
jgi:hypothetical protein